MPPPGPNTPTCQPTTTASAVGRGPKKAAVAIGHSILIIAYHLIDRDEVYSDLGADYFIQRQTSTAHRNRLVRQLEAMGHKVTLQPLPDAA